MFHLGPFTFDGTVNLPTIVTLFVIAHRIYNWYKKIFYKIDTMWEQFLIEHPEHERREVLRLSALKGTK